MSRERYITRSESVVKYISIIAKFVVDSTNIAIIPVNAKALLRSDTDTGPKQKKENHNGVLR